MRLFVICDTDREENYSSCHAIISEHHLDVLMVAYTWIHHDMPDHVSNDVAPEGLGAQCVSLRGCCDDELTIV